MTGFVYAIEAGGRIKLGWSDDPARRVSELRTGSPFPATLLAATPGTLLDELELHHRFAQFRLHNEWFGAAEEIRALISQWPPYSAPRLPRSSRPKRTAPAAFPVFEKLGGQEIALAIIEAETKKRPTDHAVRSWRDARRIPGKDAMILIKELERRGISYSSDDFESDKPKRSRDAEQQEDAA